MPKGVPKEQKFCTCGKKLRAGWPHPDCATCRAVTGDDADEAKPKRKARAAKEEPVPAFDAIALIASLGLDYCVGSAARFLLEAKDGDELENLKTARTYVDHAIATREATV